MNLDYFTHFELMSKREKDFFRGIGRGFFNNIGLIGNAISKGYKATPRAIKIGALVAVAFGAGILVNSQFGTKVSEEKEYFVSYSPPPEPTYQHPGAVYERVNGKRLVELMRQSERHEINNFEFH